MRNASETAFSLVVVQFPAQTVAYGSLQPGGSSAYQTVARAYRYARIEVEIAEQTYILQPVDYVGEELLERGRYTYDLGFDPDAGTISLRLQEDGS